MQPYFKGCDSYPFENFFQFKQHGVLMNVCKCNTKSILFVNTFTCLLCPTTYCTMSLFTEARNRFFYTLRQYLKKKHSYMITAVMNIYFKTFSYTSQFHKKLEGPYLLFIRRFKLNVCRTEKKGTNYTIFAVSV